MAECDLSFFSGFQPWLKTCLSQLLVGTFHFFKERKKKEKIFTEKEGKKKCESIFLKDKIIKGCRLSQP